MKENDQAASLSTASTSSASTSRKSTGTSSGRQTDLTKFIKSDKITITMTAQTFQKSIIDLVVQNCLPLIMFSQPAFQNLIGEMARKFNIPLDRRNIRRIIIEEAEKKKEELRNALSGQYLFLKMDAATRHRVNYFAINVRYCTGDGKMITNTLAVKDTKAKHDSNFLQSLIEKVLKDFNIDKDNIISIVTDNASNMVKTIEKLNESQEADSSEESRESTDDNTALMTEADQEQTDESLDDVAEEASKLCKIRHMRCAVHTLQLAIRDGLKDRHAANLIGKLRQVAVAARTPKIDAIVKRRSGKGFILDQATRWGSTYLMVQRLLELRAVLEDIDNPLLSLTEIQWQSANELEELLRPSYTVTKKLQAEDLTAGEFLFEWKKLIFDMTKKGGLIAEGIVNSMNRREPQLTDNDILLASVFVDPKHRILLDEEQCKTAKQALCTLAIKMKRLHSKSNTSSFPTSLCQSIGVESSSSSDADNFESHLKRIAVQKAKKRKVDDSTTETQSTDMTLIKFKEDFSKALEEIENVGYDRKSKISLQEIIQSYREIIRDVALTVIAIPPTQVSVERLFSVLKLMKTDLRASMKEDLVEAMLFLRTLNFE